MLDELLIPSRYCGPPDSANGGYTAGALAHQLSDEDPVTVTVRLQRPPLLDVPMPVTSQGGLLSLSHDADVIATAQRSEHDLEPVEPVSLEQARAASEVSPALNHPFPTCFVCGPGREDGLRILPGQVDGSPIWAAPWTPDESLLADFHELSGPEARVCTAATWAALDCPGGWAAGFDPEQAMVLGSMTARVEATPVVGEPHVVVAQRSSEQSTSGRTTRTSATLYDSDQRIVGTAEHIWVAVDPATFGAAQNGAVQ